MDLTNLITETNDKVNERIARAFYWNASAINRVEVGSEDYLAILQVNKIRTGLHSIIFSNSLSRKQMSEKLTILVNNQIKSMNILLAFLDTNFNYLQCILSEEVPLVLFPALLGENKTEKLNVYLDKLDEWTQIITVADLGFIPLSQYTTLSDWEAFINRKVKYADISLEYEMSDNGVFEIDYGTATLVAIDGWHPERSVENMDSYLTTMLNNLFENTSLNKIQERIIEWMNKCNIDNYYDSFRDLAQYSSEEEIRDSIFEMINDFGYYNFVNFIDFLTKLSNEISMTHGFRAVIWTGYSQGESGLILYEYIKSNFNPDDKQDEYFTAIARGDAWFKM